MACHVKYRAPPENARPASVSEFGDHVEYAARATPMVWRLMIWDVRDANHSLLTRLGFRATKKNPASWWRIFDPAAPHDREFAERCRVQIRGVGLKGSWQQVERHSPPKRPPAKVRFKKFTRHVPAPSREGFGGALNARPIAGSWRRKARRK